MDKLYSEIAEVLKRADGARLTEEAKDELRHIQRKLEDAHWDIFLADLKARSPWQDQPPHEQDRGIIRAAQINDAIRHRRTPRGKAPAPRPNGFPQPCAPGWTSVATIPIGGFGFGSADTPVIVPSNNSAPANYDIAASTSIAATYRDTSQMSLGVAVGGWCDVVWEPTQSFFRLQGNRVAATLAGTVPTPPLGTVAPGALTVSCSVNLNGPTIGLVAGDPGGPGNPNVGSTFVYVCGKAFLRALIVKDVTRLHELPWDIAQDEEMLFIDQAFGEYSKNITNTFNENSITVVDDITMNDLNQPINLSATFSKPPADATSIYVSVTVELSAWTLPAIQSVALVDATGQNQNMPVIDAPLWLYPGSTADNTAPIQISPVQICGIGFFRRLWSFGGLPERSV